MPLSFFFSFFLLKFISFALAMCVGNSADCDRRELMRRRTTTENIVIQDSVHVAKDLFFCWDRWLPGSAEVGTMLRVARQRQEAGRRSRQITRRFPSSLNFGRHLYTAAAGIHTHTNTFSLPNTGSAVFISSSRSDSQKQGHSDIPGDVMQFKFNRLAAAYFCGRNTMAL